MAVEIENQYFSLDSVRSSRRTPNLTEEEKAESKSLCEQIAARSSGNIGANYYEEMPDGHVRTYTLGDQRSYDPDRMIWVDKLTVSISETKQTASPYGNREDFHGKVVIGPYSDPLMHFEIREHFSSGGIATRSWGHILTPAELTNLLSVLTDSPQRDPRQASWMSMVVK